MEIKIHACPFPHMFIKKPHNFHFIQGHLQIVETDD